MFFQGIQYVTVVIAAVVAMIIGFVWYAPWAFGKLWIMSKGWTEEQIKARRESDKSMVPAWSGLTASTLVIAFVIAALLNSLVVTSFAGLFLLALCVWAGFTVHALIGDLLFGEQKMTAFLITAGYELVAIIAMTLVIGIWG